MSNNLLKDSKMKKKYSRIMRRVSKETEYDRLAGFTWIQIKNKLYCRKMFYDGDGAYININKKQVYLRYL